MKPVFFIALISLLVCACSTVKETSKTTAVLTKSSQDTTEYEISILDPDFDVWYLYNYTPAKDYTNEFYRSQNMIAVINWNDYYRKGRYGRVIECYIDYQSNIDYGIEVNRKLWWYFKYIDNKYRIHLFGNLIVP
jgi:hypothetical protein